MPTAAPTAREALGLPIWRGDVGIGRRPAHRDLQQRAPDPHFEIRADHDHVQRLVGRHARDRRCAPARARSQPGPRRTRHSASAASCRRAPPLPRPDRRSRGRRGRAAPPSPAPCRRARGGSRSASVRPAPPVLKSPGVIASWVTKRSCSRPGPGEAELIGGVEDRGGIAQQVAGAVERHRLQEGLGRDARPSAGTDDGNARPTGRHGRRSPPAKAGRASASEMKAMALADAVIVLGRIGERRCQGRSGQAWSGGHRHRSGSHRRALS